MSKTSDILGFNSTFKVASKDCFVCGKPIDKARKQALHELNIRPNRWTHTKCSQDEKTKGIYMGENGTSQLQLVDKVYQDSVRDVFVDNVVEEN